MSAQLPSELVPKSKPFLNLSCYKRRLQWTQGTLSEQGNRATVVLPNEDAISLNGRLRFDVTVSPGAGGTNECPEFLGSSFFQRLMLTVGGSVIVDWDQYHLQQSIWEVLNTADRQSKGVYSHYGMASAAQKVRANREGHTVFSYDIPLSLMEGTFWENKRQLLPLFMLPRTELVLYTNSNASATTGTTTAATYQLSNLEIGYTYYTSPAIKSYFSSVPYELGFTGVSHRTMTLSQNQQIFNLNIPSNYRSIRAICAVFRPQGIESNGLSANKHITYDGLSAGRKYNVRVNGFRVYQTDLGEGSAPYAQQWQEVKRVFGENVEKSTFYNLGTEYDPAGDKFILVSKLNCLSNFVSGAKTNQHVSSLELLLDAGAPLAANTRMDLFILHDKLLSISGSQLSVVQ